MLCYVRWNSQWWADVTNDNDDDDDENYDQDILIINSNKCNHESA